MNDEKNEAVAAEPDSAPDPDFIRNLEWQVRTVARREARFARPPARGPMRVAKLAVIAAVALAGGASGTLAVQHLQQSRTATILGHRAQLELALAERRAVALQIRFEKMQQQQRAGVVPSAEVETAQAALVQGQVAMNLRRLDLEETSAGGRAPDDALFALRVGGRDFVSERLTVRRDEAAQAIVGAEQALQRVGRLVDSGFAPVSELDAARADLTKRRAALATFAARDELRRRFLAGELSAARVELEERRVVAESRTQELGTTIVAAEAGLRRAQELQQKGFVPQADVEAATLALTEARGALELDRDELTLIDEQLATTK